MQRSLPFAGWPLNRLDFTTDRVSDDPWAATVHFLTEKARERPALMRTYRHPMNITGARAMRIAHFPTARHPAAWPSLFTGPKCKVAIPVHDILLLDALQQASLAFSVRSISYRTGPQLECPRVSLAGAVLHKDDGAYLLRVSETRPQRGSEEIARLAHVLDCHGLRLLERDAQDVHRAPLFSNARAVWSHAGRHVSLIDRLKIAVALEDGGPQSIAELEERVRPGRDLVDAVCALACENLLRLDITDAHLGPRTIVLGS